MSFLRMRGAELDSLAGRLDRSAGQMDLVRGALESADIAGLGSGELDGACNEFSSSWGYGVGQLGKCTGNASGFLRLAIQTFDDTDRQLAEGLRNGGQGDRGGE